MSCIKSLLLFSLVALVSCRLPRGMPPMLAWMCSGGPCPALNQDPFVRDDAADDQEVVRQEYVADLPQPIRHPMPGGMCSGGPCPALNQEPYAEDDSPDVKEGVRQGLIANLPQAIPQRQYELFRQPVLDYVDVIGEDGCPPGMRRGYAGFCREIE